jgi:hypothetical protein
MPTWLVPTLKWGGIGLAIIAAVVILYVRFIAATPAPGAKRPAPRAARPPTGSSRSPTDQPANTYAAAASRPRRRSSCCRFGRRHKTSVAREGLEPRMIGSPSPAKGLRPAGLSGFSTETSSVAGTEGARSGSSTSTTSGALPWRSIQPASGPTQAR